MNYLKESYVINSLGGDFGLKLYCPCNFSILFRIEKQLNEREKKVKYCDSRCSSLELQLSWRTVILNKINVLKRVGQEG